MQLLQQRRLELSVKKRIVKKRNGSIKILEKPEEENVQHGTGYHCNGTGYIVFLYSEQITGKAGQRRHSKQQEAKTPIPAGIKKIACAGKQHNPLSFPPEYIPVQKKDNGKKERKPECRK